MAVATGVSSKKRRYIFGGLFFGGVIAVCVLLVYHWEYLVRFQQYGYLGLFIMTIVTGFSIPLPIPYMVLTFTLGAYCIRHWLVPWRVWGLALGVRYFTLRGVVGADFFPSLILPTRRMKPTPHGGLDF